MRKLPAASHRRNAFGRLVPMAAWLLTACAPASAPDTRLHVDSTVTKASHEAYAEMLTKFPPYESPALQGYVQSVGARLLAAAPRTGVRFGFTVLDSPGVFAYSFAHGEVVISRGLLVGLNSEAQLAATLAHEIGHIVSSHQALKWQEIRETRELEAKLAERFSTAQARDTLSTFSLARVRGYSRAQEIEADVWSERLLTTAGYDAGAMAQVLRYFMQQDAFSETQGFEFWEIPEPGMGHGVFATHPSPEARLEQTTRRLGVRARAAGNPDPAYLNILRGVEPGLSPRYGLQRGARYLHPARRVAFSLPKNWYLFGTDDKLVAAPRGQDGLLIIRMMSRPETEPLRRTLEELARGNKLESVENISAASTSGQMAVIRLPAKSDTQSLRLAAIDVGQQRLTFVGLTFSPANWGDADAHFRALLGSVRTATEAERHSTQPLRISIEQARLERPFAPQAQPFADLPRERWELLNQLYPAGQVATGRWIKSVH